jgi:hypothetical protein
VPLTTPTADLTDTTEALMQFLYRAPIGLAQTSLGGDIEMVNPMSAQLLLPLSPNGSLDNLFTTLEAWPPNCGNSLPTSRRHQGSSAKRCA